MGFVKYFAVVCAEGDKNASAKNLVNAERCQIRFPVRPRHTLARHGGVATRYRENEEGIGIGSYYSFSCQFLAHAAPI